MVNFYGNERWPDRNRNTLIHIVLLHLSSSKFQWHVQILQRSGRRGSRSMELTLELTLES